MKKFLIGLAAVALLSGTASAQTTTTVTDQKVTVKKHTPHVKHQSSTTGAGGYTTLPPTRDYGRYSNLPGKDKLNSKAYIENQ
jgi:hypothetical protein